MSDYIPDPSAKPAPANGAPAGSTIYHSVNGRPAITTVGNPVPSVMTQERISKAEQNTVDENGLGFKKKEKWLNPKDPTIIIRKK